MGQQNIQKGEGKAAEKKLALKKICHLPETSITRSSATHELLEREGGGVKFDDFSSSSSGGGGDGVCVWWRG